MKKKLLSLALALAMALSLAACGNGSSSGDSTSGSGSQTASDGSITIKIGGIGPLTGSNATYGLATYYGAHIAVDEINALDSWSTALRMTPASTRLPSPLTAP